MKKQRHYLLMTALFCGSMATGIGCVPSFFPMVVKKDKEEKPIIPAKPVAREPSTRVQPGQIDDANAAEMLQAIRREIDMADYEPPEKP
jgi:hypothetical protein